MQGSIESTASVSRRPSVGDKVIVEGTVLYQVSAPVSTLAGTAYSHFHIIQDSDGHLYQYKGSSFFPLNNHVKFSATIKGYARGKNFALITIVKAPKAIES